MTTKLLQSFFYEVEAGRSGHQRLAKSYLAYLNIFQKLKLKKKLKKTKTVKIAVLRRRFSVITFDSVKTRHSVCQHRFSLFKTRRMNYNLTLKGNIETLTSGQGHDLIGKGHVAYQSIRMVYL